MCEPLSVCMKLEWRGREPTWGPGSPSWRSGASPTCRKVNCTYNSDTANVLTYRVTLHLITRQPISAEFSIFNINIVYVQYQYALSSTFSMTQCFFYIQCKCFYYYCPVITLHAFNGNRFFLFFQTLFILSYIFVSMTRFFFTLDNNVFHLQYQHLFVLNTKMFYMFNSI